MRLGASSAPVVDFVLPNCTASSVVGYDCMSPCVAGMTNWNGRAVMSVTKMDRSMKITVLNSMKSTRAFLLIAVGCKGRKKPKANKLETSIDLHKSSRIVLSEYANRGRQKV